MFALPVREESIIIVIFFFKTKQYLNSQYLFFSKCDFVASEPEKVHIAYVTKYHAQNIKKMVHWFNAEGTLHIFDCNREFSLSITNQPSNC